LSRILALDVGDKRIGLAISDPMEIIASPLSIIQRITDEQALADILHVIKEKEVQKIIAGMPYAPDGGIGLQADKVQSFVNLLQAQTGVPVVLQSERFSTNTAMRLKKEAGGKKTDKKVRYDAMAAAVILQEYLDEQIKPATNDE